MKLHELKDIFSHVLGKKAEAMQELEVSLRAKGNVTRGEDVTLRACMMVANTGFTVVSAVATLASCFVTGQVNKFSGGPPVPRLLRFGLCAGAGLFTGKVVYYVSMHACAVYVVDHGEERMKMELANIILTKHSDDKSLVEAVKRNFFAEHLYSDQHQDKPLSRWRQRHSYVDSNFMERVKEVEANNSDDKVKTISGQTTRSFGDLMEDPLACILGSPDSKMEGNKPPEDTATILRKTDLRARRKHRHHHRHAALLSATPPIKY